MVVALLSLIVVAIAPYFRSVVSSWEVKDRRLEQLQLGRLAMDDMTKTIKTATAFTNLRDNDIGFTDISNNTVRFRLTGSSLGKRIGTTGSDTELAPSVDSLAFTYYDENGTVPANVTTVRSIKIALNISDPANKAPVLSFSSQVTPRKDPVSVVYNLAINEINYDASWKNQWVELYNNETVNVDVSGSSIATLVAGFNGTITKYQSGNTSITSYGYAVIAADKSAFSDYPPDSNATKLTINAKSAWLNITGDTITIIYPGGADSVVYGDWAAAGETLERKSIASPANDTTKWESSNTTGGWTPGYNNTITP